MLNLLIISDNPKAKLIQNFMQPLIKTKIDVAADFDHGLKEVFEKRPAIVIIQEQIAGITGESVARHIQLLFGSGAPTFIMMHEGNARIKPVKGLFEVIVDFDQSVETLVEEVLSVVKHVIGDEWDKVAILPPQEPVRVVLNRVPDEHRVAADKLVEDFFSDLETSNKRLSGQFSDQQAGNAEHLVAPTSDEIASMLINAAQKAESSGSFEDDPAQAETQVIPLGNASRSMKEKNEKSAINTVESASVPPVLITTGHLVDRKSTGSETFEMPELDSPTTLIPDTPPEPSNSPEVPKVAPLAAPQAGSGTLTAPPSPADFRISGLQPVHNEQRTEDILLAFNENYHSRSRSWVLFLSALVMAIFLSGGWYLYKAKPQLLHFWKKSKTMSAVEVPVSTIPVEEKKPSAAPATHKPVSSAVKSGTGKISSVPSFVHVKDRDGEFSVQKPGWERYIDERHDVRIFRVAGRIKAIQVLAVKGQVIADSFIQMALKEVTGSSAYSLRSQEQKQGILIQRCNVGSRVDLLVYRKQPSNTISAFVVSLE